MGDEEGSEACEGEVSGCLVMERHLGQIEGWAHKQEFEQMKIKIELNHER